MRDYLFDAVTGYFLVDKATGWEWGYAELDPARHTIIRTNALALPNGEVFGQPLQNTLVCPSGLAIPAGTVLCVRPLMIHFFKLDHPLDYSGQDNVWGNAVLALCAECECILPSRYLDVHKCKEWSTEDDMWGSVSDGDGVLYQGWGDSASRPLWAMRIISVAEKLAEYKQVATVEEAVQWLS